MDELLAEFLTETHESLAGLDTALVRFEQAPDEDATLAAIFRLVHTIKGTCGFLGLPRLERLGHAVENVLGQMRDGALAPSSEIVTLVLEAFDQVRTILAGLGSTGAEPAGNDDDLVATLAIAVCGRPLKVPPPGTVPAHERMADATTASAVATAVSGQTIRVSVSVLENLMILVGELVLTRNQLLQLARGQDSNPASVPLQRLSRITSEIQEGVVKTRMQPIGNAWSKLPRLVRDLANDLGKRIDLTLHGADTELDRQILEFIRDPLTHMVRNSADHGIEPPAERRASGKPEAGQITLTARHQGGHIVVEIADDGRGLSTERIRAKAIARGLATESEMAQMSESQIQRFIFHAGFSTAAAVTAVSGRGVGMDVVKTKSSDLAEPSILSVPPDAERPSLSEFRSHWQSSRHFSWGWPGSDLRSRKSVSWNLSSLGGTMQPISSSSASAVYACCDSANG